MHSADAYRVLAEELHAISTLPPTRLAALVGSPPPVRRIALGGHDAELEVSATWSDRRNTCLVVTAHLRGPSTWHHQHLQESISVRFPPGITAGA
jgi:hypothetical protein